MDLEKSQDLFNRMKAANAVAAMRLLGKDTLSRIFAAMPRSRAAQLRMRMRLSESVIGSYADADVITFSPDHRISDALRLFRESRSQQTGHAIYVTDANRKLLGQVELGELLATKESSTIQRLLRPAPAVLNARAALQSSARHPAWVTQDNLPVTDRSGLFQGVLWRSTLSDHEQQIISEVADENETATTRSALADIFWLGVGAVFTRNPDLSSQDREEK
jgi:Mg/Co/Ni transporter MgtE